MSVVLGAYYKIYSDDLNATSSNSVYVNIDSSSGLLLPVSSLLAEVIMTEIHMVSLGWMSQRNKSQYTIDGTETRLPRTSTRESVFMYVCVCVCVCVTTHHLTETMLTYIYFMYPAGSMQIQHDLCSTISAFTHEDLCNDEDPGIAYLTPTWHGTWSSTWKIKGKLLKDGWKGTTIEFANFFPTYQIEIGIRLEMIMPLY